MSDTDNLLKKEKRNKREKLLAQGVDLYPHSYKKENNTSEIAKLYQNLKTGEKAFKNHSLAGRILRKRDMGKAAFFDIQDEQGRLQCYIKKEDFKSEGQTPWELWKFLDIGDFVGIQGIVFRSRKGELSLRIVELKILCKTLETLPEKYHGLEDKELKYRFRHLDLIMDLESRKTFKMRSQIIAHIRSYMNNKGFMEVETPILQPLYGGAQATPFVTHFRRLNSDMYLKISP